MAGSRKNHGVNPASDLSEADQLLLQLVYDLMGQRGAWPTFTAVDLRADRDLGVEDAQAALVGVPPGYLSRPWQSFGFSDNDEVRLTLRGVATCDGGAEDLALLTQLVAWLVKIESEDASGGEEPLLAKSEDFAAYLELPLREALPDGTELEPAVESGGTEQPEPATEVVTARATMSRVRVLADLLPHFWGGAGWSQDEPWLWQYTVDRRRLRPYRHVRGVDALLEYAESHERAHTAVAAWTDSSSAYESPFPVETGAATPAGGSDLDVLLTMLREEVTEASADLVRMNRFDDAIFAAFRRVEHELQQRTGNSSIGNDLIKLAFLERKDPIRITEREKDKDRLVELFGGAIGLFKGDRSHKDRPLLPCRSRHECLRLLAHASTLLDLLDRDIDLAPSVRGYEHRQGSTLTLWVDRAGSQVDVWLDEAIRLDKLSFQPGTLVVDVARVSHGEHRIHLVEGHRQGAAHTVWLTGDPGLSSWYRVIEVNVPLYGDAQGQHQLDIAGVRLACLEGGVASERVVPTREVYQVGHYVSWQWSNTASTAATWVRERVGGPLWQVWDASLLFAGQPVAPAHSQRLMRISMEPSHLRLRKGEKAPLRVLAHFTDGTATWTEPLDNPQVETSDEKIITFKGGAVFAKTPGSATLRCLYAGCSAEATVEIAAYPRGTATKLLTGLPPVAGIACTLKGLVVSTRGTDLWRAGLDGVYRLIAGVPQLFPQGRGTDTLVARDDGELAVRLLGSRMILVLHHGEKDADEYCSSHIVNPDCSGTPMAFVWDDEDLIVAMDSGAVHRVAMDGVATRIASVDGIPLAVARSKGALLVLCAPSLAAVPPDRWCSLWNIPRDKDHGTDLLAGQRVTGLNGLACLGEDIYVSDFDGGRVLRLKSENTGALMTISEGLVNPGQLAGDALGALYVAEFGGGAVSRVLS
ncbi:TIGR02391 family protein [Streptomyces sp. NPDC048504]|uniref:TIGR02391 family protein n=1 Tax=Streptomyces sp. NPDC048504 TaxID=3365559 RepID=UPI00371F6A42